MSGTEDHPAGPTTRQEVLLVSPDTATLGKLAAAIQRSNELALTAGNVQDAWECVRSGVVGVVVLDLISPTLDEFALFRAARSSHSYHDLPFLFLIRKDYHPPALTSIAGETVRDAWLVLPCPAQNFIGLIQGLRRQGGGARESTRRLMPVGLSSVTLDAVSKKGEAAEAPEIAAPAGTPGIFEGQLGAIDVTKILSMLEPLKLTGTLNVTDEKREGEIHFVDGRVHHAALHDIEGADALFLLFHMRQGHFVFQKGEATSKRTIQGNTMQLLLEGLRQMDEAKAMIKAFQHKRQKGPGEEDEAGEGAPVPEQDGVAGNP
ncbi:MAG: DUF4388 domain-containing protein [Planctomycetes bacterium]|nr:DUF4388 domain-containing protein [Planctomycetota bacterium]